MLTTARSVVGVLLACAVLGLGVAHADKAHQKEGASAEAKGVSDLATAYRVAAYGLENKMPEALVTAALMLAKIDKGEALEGKEEVKAPIVEARDLLTEAKELAETKAQKALVAEAEANLKGASRALSSGGHHWSGKLKAGEMREVKANYAGKGPVVLVVRGTTTTKAKVGKVKMAFPKPAPMLLEVRASDGKLVARNSGAIATLRFTPPKAGSYKLQVRNVSRSEASFTGHTSR